MRRCGYPEWALKEGENRHERGMDKNKTDTEKKNKNTYAVLPYIKGISERMERSFKKHNIKLYHKAGETLRQKLLHPKDKLCDEEKMWCYL